MKKYTQRKRATAKNRAAKHKPPAALKNPKPHIPAPMAPRYTPSPVLDWDSEEERSEKEMAVNQPLFGCAYYFVGAGVLALLALAWWWL